MTSLEQIPSAIAFTRLPHLAMSSNCRLVQPQSILLIRCTPMLATVAVVQKLTANWSH